MRGFVRNILGQVGLIDVIILPSTLVRPCVATLGGPCVATLGSPLDRVVCNFLIICNHCFLPFTEGGNSAFIFCSRSAAASTYRPVFFGYGWHPAVLRVQPVDVAESVAARVWNVELQ